MLLRLLLRLPMSHCVVGGHVGHGGHYRGRLYSDGSANTRRVGGLYLVVQMCLDRRRHHHHGWHLRRRASVVRVASVNVAPAIRGHGRLCWRRLGTWLLGRVIVIGVIHLRNRCHLLPIIDATLSSHLGGCPLLGPVGGHGRTGP